jgi:hypothetical protein
MCHLLAVSRLAAIGVFCIAASATSAQTVYRCANSYSQTPCAGALTIPVDDSRSPAQKAQTDAATIQTRQLAGQMERERLAQEETARAAKPLHPLIKTADNEKTKPKTGKQDDAAKGPQESRVSTKKKRKEPEFFTASASSDKKNKTGGGATD